MRVGLPGAGWIAQLLQRAFDRARRRESDGFTVVELIISLSVLALVMAFLAPQFYGSIQASSTTNSRTVALGLATQANETLRDLPYYEVGYASASAVPTSCATDPVPTGSGTSTPSPVTGLTTPEVGIVSGPLTSPQTVRGVSFTITPCVYWIDANSTYTYAYKQTVVTVNWTDSSGAHQVRQSSILYPGGGTAYSSKDNFNPTTTSTMALPGTTTSTTAPACAVTSLTITTSTSTSPEYIANNAGTLISPTSGALGLSLTGNQYCTATNLAVQYTVNKTTYSWSGAAFTTSGSTTTVSATTASNTVWAWNGNGSATNTVTFTPYISGVADNTHAVPANICWQGNKTTGMTCP